MTPIEATERSQRIILGIVKDGSVIDKNDEKTVRDELRNIIIRIRILGRHWIKEEIPDDEELRISPRGFEYDKYDC